MSIALPIVGLFVGFIAVYLLGWSVPLAYGGYLAVAVLATLDTVIGGIRAGVEHRFDRTIFVSGIFVNSLAAGLLAFFGDKIGTPLTLVAAIVFGFRIFQNLSLIRIDFITSRRTHQPPSTPGEELPGANNLGSTIRRVG